MSLQRHMLSRSHGFSLLFRTEDSLTFSAETQKDPQRWAGHGAQLTARLGQGTCHHWEQGRLLTPPPRRQTQRRRIDLQKGRERRAVRCENRALRGGRMDGFAERIGLVFSCESWLLHWKKQRGSREGTEIGNPQHFQIQDQSFFLPVKRQLAEMY